MIECAWGSVRLVLDEVGGRLVSLEVDGRPLVDPEPPCAGWVLAPWPNRLRDGLYTFDGEQYEAPIDEPERRTALHGLVSKLVWSVVERGPDHIALGATLPASEAYPSALALETRWTATADGARARHEAVNVGKRRAPFAFGAHPYLWVPGVPVDDLVMELPANLRLVTDERLLPVEDAECDPWAGPIGAFELDTTFGGLRPGPTAARIRAPDGRGVEIRADGAFRWWQVYTSHRLPAPLHRRSVAIEPMTAPPDALRSGRDLVVLEPGQRWTGTWELAAR